MLFISAAHFYHLLLKYGNGRLGSMATRGLRLTDRYAPWPRSDDGRRGPEEARR